MRDLEKLIAEPRHLVVICGGAVSGSEAAAICAERGMIAVVLEQNVRPYGKIEDGLPRWHDKLRRQEYERIDENLSRPGVVFVPCTTLGRDFQLAQLRDQPGVATLLLANGAWRDRPLGLDGLERLRGKGFVYQNAFVYWFNHYEDVGYDGPAYAVAERAIVVGGGLASVDVAKIINLELYRNALQARGFAVSIVELEHLGIPKVFAEHGLRAEELGIEGATIYYRRRVRDMPIAFPRDDSPAQLAKTELVREKMVQILAQKYLVRVEECHIPLAPISSGERLEGMRFRRSRWENGKLSEIPGSDYDVPGELVVSSIGSVPEPIPGVPMKGELYDYADFASGAVRDVRGVYGLGNVLTGKGNIKESRENAREIAERTIGMLLGVSEGSVVEAVDAIHAGARERVEPVIAQVERAPKATPEQLRAFLGPMFVRQGELGYSGDYSEWLKAHPAG
jgi:ferredoxin--NADP+ reductase